jgi:hypothetical protein
MQFAVCSCVSSLLPENGWLTKLIGRSLPRMDVLLVRNVFFFWRYDPGSYRTKYASATSQNTGKEVINLKNLSANGNIILTLILRK